MSKELMCSGWIDYAVGFVVGCVFVFIVTGVLNVKIM
jgi:hypothetical protein